jgi:hypothetical protein
LGFKKDAICILQFIVEAIEWEFAISIYFEKLGVRHHSEKVIFFDYKLLGNYGAIFKWDAKRKNMVASNYIKFRFLNSLKGKKFL